MRIARSLNPPVAGAAAALPPAAPDAFAKAVAAEKVAADKKAAASATSEPQDRAPIAPPPPASPPDSANPPPPPARPPSVGPMQQVVHTAAASVRNTVIPVLEALAHDGDVATFEIRGEFRAFVVKGVRFQYGYEATVEQIGGNRVDGTVETAQAAYRVTLNKRTMGGISKQINVHSAVAGGEIGVRTADRVSMTFPSKAEATRAVLILGDLAADESLRDVGRLAGVNPRALLSNPVMDVARDRERTTGLLTRMLGGVMQMEKADLGFLSRHVTGYASRLDNRTRLSLEGQLSRLGGTLRFDQMPGVERRVEYPANGQPGRLIYTVAGETELSSKQYGLFRDPPTVNLINRSSHGTADVALDLVWEFDHHTGASLLHGGDLPELHTLPAARQARGPDAVVLRMGQTHQDWLGRNLPLPSRARWSIEMHSRSPQRDFPAALDALLAGKPELAAARLYEGGHIEITRQRFMRHGFTVQPTMAVKGPGMGIIGSFILQSSRDAVMERHVERPGGQRTGPAHCSDAPGTRPFSEQARPEATLCPNLGLPVLADENYNRQFLSGSSPWAVANASGSLNHGNPVVAVANRFYGVFRAQGVLGDFEPISNNTHARELLAKVEARIARSPDPDAALEQVMEQLANPYGLDLGSAALAASNQHLTDGQSPPPGAQAGEGPQHGERQFVRDVFQGTYRWRGDMAAIGGGKPAFGMPSERAHGGAAEPDPRLAGEARESPQISGPSLGELVRGGLRGTAGLSMTPNGGSVAVAGQNYQRALDAGSSPWSVAYASGGLNQGNHAVALANTVYATLRRHALLHPGERIRDTDHAAALLGDLNTRLSDDANPGALKRVMDDLANGYGLNFGLNALDQANQRLRASKGFHAPDDGQTASTLFQTTGPLPFGADFGSNPP